MPGGGPFAIVTSAATAVRRRDPCRAVSREQWLAKAAGGMGRERALRHIAGCRFAGGIPCKAAK